MPHISLYLDLVKKSHLLAPNLKEMTLRVFTGMEHKGNLVARHVIRDHLAALRWMNPNAVIYLQQIRGQGLPTMEVSLCMYSILASFALP